MRLVTFSEDIYFKAPEGTKKAVREAAAEEGQTLSEFIRAAIRAQLRHAGQVGAAHAAAGD